MFRRASRTTHDADLKSANQLPVRWRPTVEDYKSSLSAFGIKDPEQQNSYSISIELSSLNFKLTPLSRMFRRASRTKHDADLKSAIQLPERWRPTVEDYKSPASAFGSRYPEQRSGFKTNYIIPKSFTILIVLGIAHIFSSAVRYSSCGRDWFHLTENAKYF